MPNPKQEIDVSRWLKIFAKNVFQAILALLLCAALFLVAGVSGWICRWVVSWFA